MRAVSQSGIEKCDAASNHGASTGFSIASCVLSINRSERRCIQVQRSADITASTLVSRVIPIARRDGDVTSHKNVISQIN
jgi:hypothetical protein